jgi:uncharacterized protein (DUF697 family)
MSTDHEALPESAEPPDPAEPAEQRLQQGVDRSLDPDEQADAIIHNAMIVNAGMGLAPVGINIWTFVGVNAVMTVMLGRLYGHHLSRDGAGRMVRQLFIAVGMTNMIMILGAKFCVEVLKGVGVFTLGGATLVGMAIDSVICGAATYAVGYTMKEQFRARMQLTPEQVRQRFMAHLKQGRSVAAEARRARDQTLAAQKT